MVKKIFKILASIFGAFILLCVLLFLYLYLVSIVDLPVPSDKSALNLEIKNPSKNFYEIGNNKLRKSESGLWEMYVEGKPFERGVIIGKLSSHLIYNQEKAFVKQIKKLIPSEKYLAFLKYFIGWFNRDLDKHMAKEYLNEIYGISLFASDKFSYIADNYQRILNYHAAHDIGHALQGMHMVGCTSFSVWNDKSADSSLLVGRNFDFYVGDEFAKDKIICFFKPDKGYKFMMVSWGGMIGAVSGMNIKGLTVTLNAAKSDIPFTAKTPISILAREILQYASNIKEAYKIAKSRKTFVSECIMIGSANDNKTVIIEKTPSKIDLYSSQDNYIICSNHYQGKVFANDDINIENIKNSSSDYRFKRTKELLNSYASLNFTSCAVILRDRNGIGGRNIGMGNEKALNQLIAHHSIIFKPQGRIFWVTTNPYQLGKYVAYNLDSVFNKFPKMNGNKEIIEESLTIPADSFLTTNEFKNYQQYRFLKEKIIAYIGNKSSRVYKTNISEDIVSSNPELYNTYILAGDICMKNQQFIKALHYFNEALKKEIATNYEKREIFEKIKEAQSELLKIKRSN